MRKETSNDRLRRAMKKIQSGEKDKEDSVEELEKQFALRKKQLENLKREEEVYGKKIFMRELEKINEKLDKIDKNLEMMKGYLPQD
jgi:hypothetical protein